MLPGRSGYGEIEIPEVEGAWQRWLDDRISILVSGQGANQYTVPPITLILDSRSDFHQQSIPEQVTQTVVDNIETVQIQVQYGKTVMLTPR